MCFDVKLVLPGRLNVSEHDFNRAVFREMWDNTAADLHSSALQELPIEVRGLPHLAKNERDMGHPLIRGRDRNWTGRFRQGLKP